MPHLLKERDLTKPRPAADRQLPSASPAAARARRSRWRRRHGLAPHQIDVDEHALAEALILSGRLSEAEALRPEMVRRELSSLIGDFIVRWRHAVTRS